MLGSMRDPGGLILKHPSRIGKMTSGETSMKIKITYCGQ